MKSEHKSTRAQEHTSFTSKRLQISNRRLRSYLRMNDAPTIIYYLEEVAEIMNFVLVRSLLSVVFPQLRRSDIFVANEWDLMF